MGARGAFASRGTASAVPLVHRRAPVAHGAARRGRTPDGGRRRAGSAALAAAPRRRRPHRGARRHGGPTGPLTALAEVRVPQLTHHVAALVGEDDAPRAYGGRAHRPVSRPSAGARAGRQSGAAASCDGADPAPPRRSAYDPGSGAGRPVAGRRRPVRRTSAEARTRDPVLRAGLLFAATSDGATRFDRRMVVFGREMPGFGGLVAAWSAEDPVQRATAPGPSAGKPLVSLRTPIPMRVKSHGHGSLRPA